MHQNRGTTIIELLVYLTLFCGITVMSINWLVRLWHTVCLYDKKRVSLINLCAAHDLLVYDLERAPSIKQQWKEREPNVLIWHHSKEMDIGWMHDDKGALVRIEGIYIASEHTWQKKSKNLVIPALNMVIFKWHGTTEIIHIDFSLADTYYAIDGQADLGKRIIWKKSKMDQS